MGDEKRREELEARDILRSEVDTYIYIYIRVYATRLE